MLRSSFLACSPRPGPLSAPSRTLTFCIIAVTVRMDCGFGVNSRFAARSNSADMLPSAGSENVTVVAIVVARSGVSGFNAGGLLANSERRNCKIGIYLLLLNHFGHQFPAEFNTAY